MQETTKIVAPEYDALVQRIDDARSEVVARAKEAVGALFRAFFAANPEITAIRWTQYTPNFDDGEPCEFYVRDPEATTRTDLDWSEVHSQYDENDEPIFRDRYELDDNVRLKEALRSLERATDEDVFKAAFGDHVQIIATPSGFHVTEYSYD